MSTTYRLLALAFFLLAGVSAGRASQADPFSDLPRGFPRPPIPRDNPLTPAKIELGRYLFYDARLSGNNTQSCAICHLQKLAFADERPRAIGSTGDLHPRGSMSLVNVAYATALTWGNPTVRSLEDQALLPIFGTTPVEMGQTAPGDMLISRLAGEPVYGRLFAAAFPDEPKPITIRHVAQALASFERTIVSARSPYDRYHFEREDDAVSASAKRGEVLFFSQPLSCFRCHGGFNFSGATTTAATAESRPPEFHNTGLYNLPGLLSYPAPNTGIYEVTHRPEDVGKFKAPTLRNIALTAPYMHDGSAATLDDVIDHYIAGGRTIATGPNAGVGHDNPNKSPTIKGFTLTMSQRADLIAFLESLTDKSLLTDPRWSDPWR